MIGIHFQTFKENLSITVTAALILLNSKLIIPHRIMPRIGPSSRFPRAGRSDTIYFFVVLEPYLDISNMVKHVFNSLRPSDVYIRR